MDGQDAGSGDAGPIDGGAQAGLIITHRVADATANCMPIVRPDPVRFALNIEDDNSTGASAATATITSATMTFGERPTTTIELEFDVDMVAVGAGETTTQTHTRTMSTAMPTTCAACAGFTYEVVLDVDGEPVMLDGDGSAFCSY